MCANRPAEWDRHRDARVVALLWRLPPQLWQEPRAGSLPPGLSHQLDAMDPALLRGLLVELVYRLTVDHKTAGQAGEHGEQGEQGEQGEADTG